MNIFKRYMMYRRKIKVRRYVRAAKRNPLLCQAILESTNITIFEDGSGIYRGTLALPGRVQMTKRLSLRISRPCELDE